MTKITNNATGVRGINAKTGQVWINPGETVEVEVEVDGPALKRIEAHPDLTIEKGKAKAEKPADPPAAVTSPAPPPAAPVTAAADQAKRA